MSWKSKLYSLLEETKCYKEREKQSWGEEAGAWGGGKARGTCWVEPIVGLPKLDKNQTKTAGCTVKCKFQINND